MDDHCYHKASIIDYLRDNQNLSTDALSHFVKCHLDDNIYKLDFSFQENLDSNILKVLAGRKSAGAIQFLNLMSTNAGYAGIVELWKSPTFGSLVSDSPTYERHTGVPVSTIEIEIGHTRAYKQYEKGLFAYPLPLLGDFEITYGHRCVGEPWNTFGYKRIRLLDYGKELAIKRL